MMESFNVENYSMTLRDYTRVLFRYQGVILLSFVTVVAAVWLGLQLQTPMYEATVKMLITAQKQVESPYYQSLGGSRANEITLTQSEMVVSRPVMERAVLALGLHERPLDYEMEHASSLKALLVERQARKLEQSLQKLEPEERQRVLLRRAVEGLKARTRVEPVRDTSLFTITFSDVDPEIAAQAANLISHFYVMFDLNQQLVEESMKYGDKHPRVVMLQEMINDVERRADGHRVLDFDAIGPASVKIIEQAEKPVRPSGRPKNLIMVLAVVMGVFLGLLLAFVFEYADQTVRGPLDVERELGVPFLGSVIRKSCFGGPLAAGAGRVLRGAYALSWRCLADQIYLVMKDKKKKALLLASPGSGERSAVAALNLAVVFAESLSLKVLLVDANLRDSDLMKLLKIAPGSGPGLAELVTKGSSLLGTKRKLGENLDLISGGPISFNPITLLELTSTAELIAGLKTEYDLVLFNGPNFRDYKDSCLLADMTDQTVLVLAQGVSRRAAAKRVTEMLQAHQDRVLGAILTERSHDIPRFVYERI